VTYDPSIEQMLLWHNHVASPLSVTVHTGGVGDPSDPTANPSGDPYGPVTWEVPGVTVTTEMHWPSVEPGADLDVRVHAGRTPIRGLTLTWPHSLDPSTPVLGDAWERSYGELGWCPLSTDRHLPWYWVAVDSANNGFLGHGVRVRPNAFASWTFTDSTFSLHLDLANGGDAAVLGDRTLLAATVVGLSDVTAETRHSANEVVGKLCRRMCDDPLTGAGPIVGANNWYYAYGKGFDPDAVVADAALVSRYLGDHHVRPFGVVDAGWTPGGGAPGGPWTAGTAGLFDDMPGLAQRVRDVGARPGIWMRPIARSFDIDESLVRTGGPRPAGEHPLDPSLPEVLQVVHDDVARIAGWGFELIKHDFSTFDALGVWGPAMAPGRLTEPGWSLADRSRTNAEILNSLYDTILAGSRDGTRAGGPETLIIGCNTVGHLAAGRVHINRTGDDTSGRHWSRTKEMGVNTLAYRLPQHGRFFTVDADCVPATPQTPWAKNRQFLDAIARSGTALFVSVDPAARTPEIDADVASALQLAANGGVPGFQPLDLDTPTPSQWESSEGESRYDW
jgi:alpha-galactosidase